METMINLQMSCFRLFTDHDFYQKIRLYGNAL